ncbi:heparanase-like protein 1 [Euphorbia lathyris]|uniref:heparanase-like protein 1 n=1 Tax=Euphorbia lathyris TaxID=212925 RepID=UPI0033144DAA
MPGHLIFLCALLDLSVSLNALYGRHQIRKGFCAGAWDSSDAHAFMNYTIKRDTKLDLWKFGNELSGSGVGASVSAELYRRGRVSEHY